MYLASFERAARGLITDEALRRLELVLLADPETGDVIAGTGGFRKIRVALEGRGKRGGARVIYFLRSSSGRVFLLTVYAKSTADNIQESAKRQLREIAESLEREG